jgi:hypothetical protein
MQASATLYAVQHHLEGWARSYDLAVTSSKYHGLKRTDWGFDLVGEGEDALRLLVIASAPYWLGSESSDVRKITAVYVNDALGYISQGVDFVDAAVEAARAAANFNGPVGFQPRHVLPRKWRGNAGQSALMGVLGPPDYEPDLGELYPLMNTLRGAGPAIAMVLEKAGHRYKFAEQHRLAKQSKKAPA